MHFGTSALSGGICWYPVQRAYLNDENCKHQVARGGERCALFLKLGELTMPLAHGRMVVELVGPIEDDAMPCIQ